MLAAELHPSSLCSVSTSSHLQGVMSRPLRDPGNPGIPGLDSNPDPGIFENKIPGFFGIWYSTQDNVFKYFYWFSDNFWVFLILPEPFKVLQMFTLQTLVDSTNYYQEFLWSMQRKDCPTVRRYTRTIFPLFPYSHICIFSTELQEKGQSPGFHSHSSSSIFSFTSSNLLSSSRWQPLTAGFR